ncbi:MAG: FecR family protein [Patescibacteria group bacterium]
MKKWIFLGIAVVLFVLAVVAALFFFKNYKKPGPQGYTPVTPDQTSEKVTLPWIEVVRPTVFLVDNTGATKELQTGEEVNQGDKIKTDENGVANIYFPDGSVARLDTNTEITIDAASYDQSDKSLVVKIFVSIGKVWSKIVGLATPNSSWQVESSNAVATVRGTAFGVQVIDGSTEVIGSENNVSVQIKDAKNNILADTAVVGPDKYLKIDNNFVTGVIEKKIMMQTAAQPVPATVKDMDWIQKAQTSDALMLNLKANLPDPAQLKAFILQMQSSVQQGLDQIKALQANPSLTPEMKQQLITAQQQLNQLQLLGVTPTVK